MKYIKYIDKRTVLYWRGELRWDTRIRLQRLVLYRDFLGRSKKKWKTVSSTFLGPYCDLEATLKCLLYEARESRLARRALMKYKKRIKNEQQKNNVDVFRLPEWSLCRELEDEVYMSIVKTSLCAIGYEIDVRGYAPTAVLFFSRHFNGAGPETEEKIGLYESVDAAKAAAEGHYNNLLKRLIEELKIK